MCTDEIKKLPATECGALDVKVGIKKMIFNAARSGGKILIIGNDPRSQWLEELYKAHSLQVERVNPEDCSGGHGVHYDVVVMDEFLKMHRELEPLSAGALKNYHWESLLPKLKSSPLPFIRGSKIITGKSGVDEK